NNNTKVLSETGRDGKAPAYAHPKNRMAHRIANSKEADIRDLWILARYSAPRNCDLEFAGEVFKIPTVRQEIVQLPNDAGCVKQLGAVDACHRAIDDVSSCVTTALRGRKPHPVEAIEYPRHVLRSDPVELHVLADCYVNHAAAMLAGNVGYCFNLGCREFPPWDPDSYHEKTALGRALIVQPQAPQADKIAISNRLRSGLPVPAYHAQDILHFRVISRWLSVSIHGRLRSSTDSYLASNHFRQSQGK